MKIDKNLKELLIEQLVKSKAITEHLNQEERNEYFDMEINSLALGKPEPLAKNKQFVKSCYDGKPCIEDCTLDTCKVTAKWQD